MQNSSENLAISGEESRSTLAEKAPAAQLFPPPSVVGMAGAAAVIFFLCSSWRHALFQSTAWDLGIFDQVIYLIGQGKPPISSFLGFHIMGDHASWIFYILALFYKIYPDVHWLLAVQAVALAAGALPVWSLAKLAGLNREKSAAMAAVYLLYPVVFNINLFDFHPEVIALPAILSAILAARLSQPWRFCVAVMVILGCKGVLALTVVAMGLWLLLLEPESLSGGKKKVRMAIPYGIAPLHALFAIIIGTAWFLIVTQAIIPGFRGTESGSVGRYAYLGSSVLEIAGNLLLKPGLVLGKILSLDTFKYLFLLILPVIWGLSPRHLTPLVGALPTLVLNVLSQEPFQRSLAYQYSLPVIPFLLLAVISKEGSSATDFVPDVTDLTDVTDRGNQEKGEKLPITHYPLPITHSQLPIPNLNAPKTVIIWSLIVFLFLGESKDFWLYLNRADTAQASREAVSQIQPQASVLTDNRLAAHLAHRPTIKALSQISSEADAVNFDSVLLNLRHPWPDTKQLGDRTANYLKKSPNFKLQYQKDDILLFQKFDK
ncbi:MULTISPECIES: DUF2079 domain-containing protein [unclassified Microcoleus]|uniref:DUF2079 domain-containing protein n=1 Tax=unclassified Microcoleus TaxID=2642155 RepID=UPI002FD39ACE